MPSPAVATDRFPPPAKEALPPGQRAVYERIEARRGNIPPPCMPLLSSPELADLFAQPSTSPWSGVPPRRILEVFVMNFAFLVKMQLNRRELP